MAKEANDNSCGVTSVVLGILSIVLAGPGGLILSLIGLVFSTKQKKYQKNKWSTAGLVLNIIGLIISIIVTIFWVQSVLTAIGYSIGGQNLPEFQDVLSQAS